MHSITLEDSWQSFKSMVIQCNAPQIQQNEMELAFWAGTWSVLANTDDSPMRRESYERNKALIERQHKITGRDN